MAAGDNSAYAVPVRKGSATFNPLVPYSQDRMLEESGQYANEVAASDETRRRKIEDENRRIAQMQALYKNLSPASEPEAQYGAPSGGGPAGADPMQSSRDAIFARAKDKAGQLAASSLTALRNSMAATNTLGSGIERGETRRVLNDTNANLGETVREQAIQEVGQRQHEADTQYQGRITQRGQNLQARQASLAALAQQIGALY